MTVATTILQQLGGSRFVAMTGAKDFVGGDDRLTFTVQGKGCNRVRVTVDPSDTYTVQAMRYSPKNLTLRVVSEESDVYCDQLQDSFTRLTHLHTSL